MITKFLKIFILIAFIITSSCGIKKRWEESGVYTNPQSQESTYIWKKGKQYIAIVKTIPVKGRDKNKTIHPINISVDTISNSLEKINYVLIDKKGRKSERKPVFSEANIELLGKKIPEALKQANRNQDILFEVFQLRKKWFVLPTTVDTTAGYLFIERGRINIIFEKINEDYQGYDYDIKRVISGDASDGVYSGKNKLGKGWVVFTSKSWN